MIEVLSREYIESLRYVKEIPRFFSLPAVGRDIVAVVGPRRVGKTHVLLKTAASLLERGEQALYISFEHLWTASLDERRLAEEVRRVYPAGEVHLFLDEVQSWPHWDFRLRWLHDVKDFKIYVSGSTSELSAERVPSRLRGRYISRLLLPLSFCEVASAARPETFREVGAARRLFEEYVKWGGFPEVWLSKSLDKVRALVDTVFYRDVVERRRVRDVEGLEALFKTVLENYANPVTWRSLSRSLGLDVKTTAAYIRYLSECYFVHVVERYGPARRRARAPRKLYLVDTSFTYLSKAGLDMGRRLENVVYIELLRKAAARGGKIYYVDVNGVEVDFAYVEGDAVELYEVAYEPDERHAEKLRKAAKRLGASRSVLISWDSEDYGAVPAWRWLLANCPAAGPPQGGFRNF
ncbi:ATP-binding protein [Pyrobaculum sp.]|uniref:ATP-binding protein n=1 Tax=Pyrobaculum sp. TaxID=2004705 RepID=UPI003D0A1B54